MGTWKKDQSGKWNKASSSKKKNYTIVNGKKVEQTSSTKTAPATSNSTWNNDTVTLEEAKQQTADVDRGIINVDTGSTSLTSTPSTSISLSDAAKQTETEKRVLASESTNSLLGGTVTESYVVDGDTITKTTETVEQHNDLSAIKVGGSVKSAAQMGTVTKKKTTTQSIKNPYASNSYLMANKLNQVSQAERLGASLTPEQAKRMATLLGSENTPSGTGQEGSIALKPGEKTKESVLAAFASGVKTGEVSQETSARLSGAISQSGASKKVYDSGLQLAEKLRNVGNKAVDKGTDAVLAANKYNPLSIVPQSTLEAVAPTANKFVKGAVVNSTTGLIQGAAAVPTAVETAVKNPAAFGGVLLVGTGVMIGSTVQGLKNDPVTTLGELTGMYMIGKTSGKAVNKIGDEVRTRGRIEVPVETLAQEKVISGKATFPTVPKGTPISSVLADFKQSVNLHPQPELLKKMGGEYGVHVSPGDRGAKFTTKIGSSEAPGLYTGPDASLHFAGLDKTKYKLLGLAKDSSPTINFMQMKGIERLPKSLRGNSKGAYDFTLNKAKKGKGYTTAKMESGIKVGAVEPELVIPPGTEYALNANASGFYTKFKGRKLPVNVYERVKNPLNVRKGATDTVKASKGKVYRESDYSGLNERVVLSDRDLAAMGSRSKGKSSSKRSVSSSGISSLIKPSVPSSLSSSRKSSKVSSIPSSIRPSKSGSRSGSRSSSYAPSIPSSGSGGGSSGSSGGGGGGSGYSGNSGSGESFVSSRYPYLWKGTGSGGSTPIVVAAPGLKKSKRSKKSVDTGVKHKIELTGIKNIWDVLK